MIHCRGVRKHFGDVRAVDGLDLEIPPRTCFGLLGPNGAGKTTTISMLVGLERQDQGEVEVLGRSWDRDARGIRQRIGVQLQETQLLEKLSVAELVRLFRCFYGRGRPVEEILERVGLREKAGARYSTLSGGQKQRLALGCALVGDPELLFLDEPTTGLDPQARRRVWEIVEELRSAGRSVLLTTHYMDEAERLCDRIVVIDHGKAIADGTPSELIGLLGASGLVELILAEQDGERAEALCRDLPAVVRCQREGSRIRLHTDDTRRVLPRLVEKLEEAGVAYKDLHTHRPTLEDVFVHLTGRSLRDG
ncbi:ABC transporter ATPase [Acidobacteria bacterium Mor1]|nr:ABC transporter ATPase [Acidobacteria bacterium Mor1]